ncbi:MAG: DNA primase small subunit domain-containing protein [Nanoarchaeota archaeon]
MEETNVKEGMGEKEKRVRAITKIYYSNPKVQEAILKFSAERETVPRYFEGFGKRPDMLQYPSDIMGLVNKGATSFHCSEEIWLDPLKINSDMGAEQIGELRKSWDLLIDIDSKYLDMTREAAKLVIEFLENMGIKNYGLKFSGSKGFHIIVSGKAFPEEYDGRKMKEMFPEWPRAITEYIFYKIKPEFRKRVGAKMSLSSLDKNKGRAAGVCCKQCQNLAVKGTLVKFRCPVCNMTAERRDFKLTKRRIRCLNEKCAGVLEVIDSLDYYYCEKCADPDNEKMHLSSNKYPEHFERVEVPDEDTELDLVLVAPRHLFRAPYSLHEKTALASIVLRKEQLDGFSPRDADPLKVRISNFMPANAPDEAKKILADALEWKKSQISEDEKVEKGKYKKYQNYSKIEIKNVTEAMFPKPIKKLLKGLKEGRKRGLFILITFLKSLNFSPEFINARIREWNKLNEPQLKEGYIKGQIDWHLKQKRQILPPNYNNESFYKDIGLLDEKPQTKNPIVDVMRVLRKNS